MEEEEEEEKEEEEEEEEKAELDDSGRTPIYSYLSVVVSLRPEQCEYEALQVTHHDSTEVVKLCQDNVVQCLTLLSYILRLLLLLRKRGTKSNSE